MFAASPSSKSHRHQPAARPPRMRSTYEKMQLWMEPEHYRDLTPSQRLLLLYRYIHLNKILRPGEYAKAVGISRPAIYYQLQMLSGTPGVSLVRAGHGKWTFDEYLDDFEFYEEEEERSRRGNAL